MLVEDEGSIIYIKLNLNLDKLIFFSWYRQNIKINKK